MKRRDYIWAILILLLGSYCLYLNLQVKALEDKYSGYPSGAATGLEEGAGENETITLYFTGPNAENLVGEKRAIKELTPLKAVQALIEGPRRKDLTSALPRELEASNVAIKDGIAYVYIHESVPLAMHGNYGSSTATLHMMNSISGTLILHKPFGIRKVKLEGDIVELLQGVETEAPFGVNMDLITASEK